MLVGGGELLYSLKNRLMSHDWAWKTSLPFDRVNRTRFQERHVRFVVLHGTPGMNQCPCQCKEQLLNTEQPKKTFLLLLESRLLQLVEQATLSLPSTEKQSCFHLQILQLLLLL